MESYEGLRDLQNKSLERRQFPGCALGIPNVLTFDTSSRREDPFVSRGWFPDDDDTSGSRGCGTAKNSLPG